MNHVKRISFSFLAALSGALPLLQHGALRPDAFFTTQEIQAQILRAIEDSAESIGHGSPEITSRKKSSRPCKARQRSVHVKRALGTDASASEGPLAGLPKGGFESKVLPREELIHSNFAIFDCKIMMAGSVPLEQGAA